MEVASSSKPEPTKDDDLSAEKAVLAEITERALKERRPGWILTIYDDRMTLSKAGVEHSRESRSFVYINTHLNMGDEQGRCCTLSYRSIAKDQGSVLIHRPIDEIVQNLCLFMDHGTRTW